MIKTKPKLEDFIPFLGLKHYVDRCAKERKECYGLLTEEPKDFTIEMILYHTIIGGALTGGALTYLACFLEYMSK